MQWGRRKVLEFKQIVDVSPIEVTLGVLLFLVSLSITIYLINTKGFGNFINGFALITAWNAFEVMDEFFFKNATRELVFNIGGRAILIIGMILLILAFKQFHSKK